MQTFEELSDIFSDHNNYLTSRELLMRVSVVCCIYFKCNLTMLPSKSMCVIGNLLLQDYKLNFLFFQHRKALQSLPVWRVVPRSTRNAHTRDYSCRRKW